MSSEQNKTHKLKAGMDRPGPVHGDTHMLRPEQDYPVWRSRLPEGYVMLDEVRIEFPG